MTRYGAPDSPTHAPDPCAAFDVWLDQGAPDSPAMRAHAALCPRCAARLAAEESIRDWLAPPGARAPEGFTDRVMLRVGRLADTTRPATWDPRTGLDESGVPWWLDALRQPATVLAAMTAGLLAWQFDRLAAAAVAATVAATAWLSGASGAFGAVAARALGTLGPAAAGGAAGPGTGFALALLAGLLPPLLLGSLAAARWAARLTAR